MNTEFAYWTGRLLGRGVDAIAAETVAAVTALRGASLSSPSPTSSVPQSVGAAPSSSVAPVVRATSDVVAARAAVEGCAGSAFVCLAVPDLRDLLAMGGAAAPLQQQRRESGAPTTTTPGTAAATATSGGGDTTTTTTSDNSLSFPDRCTLWELGKRVHAITLGADAVELRVDCLTAAGAAGAGSEVGGKSSDGGEGVLFQLALLRRALTLASRPAIVGPAPVSAAAAVAAASTTTASHTRRNGGSHGLGEGDGEDPLPVPPLPVIYTVRSDVEGGAFDTTPSTTGGGGEGAAAQYASLMMLGVRAGVAAIDVEVGRGRWPGSVTESLMRAAGRSNTHVITSCHWPSSPPPPADEVAAALQRCRAAAEAAANPANTVKLVASSSTTTEALAFRASALDLDAAAAAAAAASVPAALSSPSHPSRLVVIVMGQAGAVTRVLNDCLTPVTHRDLTRKAAPGQLTLEEIRPLRDRLGMAPSGRHCHLFGSPIGASVSPALHTAAFRATHAPLTYGLHEATSISAVAAVVRDPLAHCAGGNITIPLKQDALSVVDTVSPVVAVIGAVNTLLVVNRSPSMSGGGRAPSPGAAVQVHGENTDWLGIYLLLRAKLAASRPGTFTSRNIIVLGAGGTAMAACFAVVALGCRPVVVNRTEHKAVELAAAYGGRALPISAAENGVDGRVADGEECCAIISTLPAGSPSAISMSLLLRCRPVVFDVSYRPYWTPLLHDAAAAGCSVVHGVEMLCLQGFAAEQIWTGRSLTPLHEPCAGVEVAELGAAALSTVAGQ